MNPKRCPLCQKENHCAISAGKPAKQCWCMKDLKKPSVNTPAVLMLIPEADTSCYCEPCLEKVKASEQAHQGPLFPSART
ncbi:cysteine-rich CWC family protein [Endozoicomonas sp. ONNA1]|uniref:cysteine-rich CWC family protein n=1 Tax=unclassified Endozoicomonas TaxID=2644528 RepID=UPI0034D29FA7